MTAPYSSHGALALQGQCVLLVEDCPDQGRLFLEFLQQSGAEVFLECSGESAVATVSKSPTRFDTVVMDFQMARMGGLDATRHLRRLGYQGTIVAVTAYGSDELKASWFQAGCDEFLDKPLGKAELIAAVARHAMTAIEDLEE